MKTHAKYVLTTVAILLLIAIMALGSYAYYSKKHSPVSKKLENSFQNLITITDINSSLRVNLVSFKRYEGYLDPEIIVRVENVSNEKISFSPDPSSVVSNFIIADENWIKIFNNNDIFFLANGKEIILHPKNMPQPNDLSISVYPIFSYPTGYNTDGMKWQNVVRILITGELILKDKRLPVGAYIDVPFH